LVSGIYLSVVIMAMTSEGDPMFRTRTRLKLLTILVAAGSLSVTTDAAPPSAIQVTTTIADFGASYPLRIQSDRQGAYVTKIVKNVTQVESVLWSTSAGTDFTLTTYYSSKGSYAASNRSVFFDLTEEAVSRGFVTPAIGTDSSGMPVPYGQATAHLITKCSMVNVDMLSMPQGSVALCPGTFRFQAPNGQWYRLAFQPENVAQVDRMNVTCTRYDRGCRTWTVTPGTTTVTGTDPNPKSLNTLLRIDAGGTVLEEGSDYRLSFSITVAR
jgi:hypothetical protein